MYNETTYETDNLSFGQCMVYVGLAGATPDTQLGAVASGANFSTMREMLDVRQGTPRTLIKRFVPEESATMTVTGLEWNMTNLYYGLGGGVVTDAGAGETTFEFGGSLSMVDLSVKVVHEMPSGSTIEILMWKCNGSGEVALPFSDDVHQFEYTFSALHATTDWANTSLASNKQLYKIRYIT